MQSATARNQGRVPKCGENKRELPEGAPDQSKRLKYDVSSTPNAERTKSEPHLTNCLRILRKCIHVSTVSKILIHIYGDVVVLMFMSHQVDASVQQDAIAKYRQLKAMKMAGKPIPKVAKQRHQK